MSPGHPSHTRSSRWGIRPCAAWAVTFFFFCIGLAAPMGLDAQSRGTAPSGVELALSGPSVVVRGRPMHYRGTAYRVRGLATLEPLPRASIHARFEWGIARAEHGAEVDVVADADGRFELAITPPTGWDETLVLRTTIGEGDDARDFDFAMTARRVRDARAHRSSALRAGEPVHVWALVRDARSMRPLADERVHIEVTNGPLEGTTRDITTLADGVASTTLELPAGSMEGHFSIVVTVADETRMLHPRRRHAHLLAPLRAPRDGARARRARCDRDGGRPRDDPRAGRRCGTPTSS